MTEVPTEETAGQSEDINFDDLYNLTRDAQLNIDNINNNEENKAHVLEDISSMLVQMEHDDDENNVLNEVLDSILDQIVLNNDIAEPETISSSSSSLSGVNLHGDLSSGRSRSDSISSLSSLSSIGSGTITPNTKERPRAPLTISSTILGTPSSSEPSSPSSSASTQIIGSLPGTPRGGSRKHYKKHYITKRRLTKYYRKKTKKYFRRRHVKQSRRK